MFDFDVIYFIFFGQKVHFVYLATLLCPPFQNSTSGNDEFSWFCTVPHLAALVCVETEVETVF